MTPKASARAIAAPPSPPDDTRARRETIFGRRHGQTPAPNAGLVRHATAVKAPECTVDSGGPATEPVPQRDAYGSVRAERVLEMDRVVLGSTPLAPHAVAGIHRRLGGGSDLDADA